MAKTPAERQRRYRERQKYRGIRSMRFDMTPYGYSLLCYLEQRHNIYRTQLIEHALLALAQKWGRPLGSREEEPP